MHDSYWTFGRHVQAITGKTYWSNYQLRSVRKHGGRTAVQRYLAGRRRQEGFDTVVELNMPEFSIEALVLQAPWSNLFTLAERQVARARLQAAGLNPEKLHPPKA